MSRSRPQPVALRFIAAALLVGSAGCVRLNPLFQDSGGETDSGKSSTGDPATGSTTTDGNNSSSGPGSSSVGGSPVEWTPDCAVQDADQDCVGMVDAGPGGFACQAEPHSGEPGGCGGSFVDRFEIQLNAGDYIVHTPSLLTPEVSAFTGQEDLLVCATGVDEFELQGTEDVEFEVSALAAGTVLLAVRETGLLCPVPEDCCSPNDVPAEQACSDVGLRACVVATDGTCAGVWNIFCTTIAMFQCGADCT